MTDTKEKAAIISIAGSVIGGASKAPSSSEPKEEVKFDFDDEYQSKVAILCVKSNDFVKRTDGLIEPEYFTDISEATLVKLSQDYFKRYRQLPSGTGEWVEILKEAKFKRTIREDLLPDLVEKLKYILKHGDAASGVEYASDRCGEFARHQAVSKALPKIMDLVFEKKNLDEASKIIQKAFDVGANSQVDDIDYFEDIEKRTQYRKDVVSGKIRKQGLPFGMPKLDRHLHHGGLGRKELSAFMAGAKRGKSIFLNEVAVRFAHQGFKILYVTLELSKDMVSTRIDANVSNVKISDINSNIIAVEKAIITRRAASKGLIKINEFPTGSCKPSDIRRLVEKYKGDGILFDAIIVDYADIMAPERHYPTEIERSKSIWIDLRAIAQQEDVALVTATQTNRAGHTASTAKAEDVAEDFNKIRIADLIISINSTDEEAEKDEARLHFAASRNQASAVTIKIKRDLSKGKAITGVLGGT